jgi:hypothetical protein
MERAHYRRVTGRSEPPPPLKEKPPSESGGFKDKLLTQAIIAALAMIAVMAVCFFEAGKPARSGLRQALTGETTASGLFAQIKNIGMEWLGETPQQAQQETQLQAPSPNIPAVKPSEVTIPQTQLLPETGITNPASQVQPDSGIVNHNPPAVIGEESKSPVPELPAYPEP